MIWSYLLGNTKLGTQERGSNLSYQLFSGISLIAKAFASALGHSACRPPGSAPA